MSKIGTISKAQKAQSFENMLRKYFLKIFMKSSETVFSHLKGAFHAQKDSETTFFPTGNKKKHVLKKVQIFSFGKCHIAPKNVEAFEIY